MLVAHAGGSALVALELMAPVVLIAAAAATPRGVRRRALAAAALVLAVAASPPVHGWAATSVTGHMVQHLLLVVLAAPAVAVGAVALGHRRPSLRGLRAAAVAPVGAPVAAGAAHAAVLVAWHVPAPYDAAVASGWVHGAEHVTLLVTGAWWWAAVLHHAPRRPPFAPALSLFTVAGAGAAIGVLMMFAPVPLYSSGGVADQQVAGALMAGTGGVYGAVALVLVARAVARLEQPRRRRVPPASRVLAPAVVVAAGVCALAWLAGPAATTTAHQVEPRAGDPAALGQELYRRDCAACHGPAGEGSFRGVPLTEVGTASVYYSLSTGRMPIARPDSAVRRGDPAYDPDEIDAIVEHTRSFVDGPDLPSLGEGLGVARGGELYRLHCAACHGATGIGGAQAFGREAPPVLPSARDEVVAAVVAGPGGMPAFSATLADDEIAAVADYVALLQDPPTVGLEIPGGRVGEGLVAWLVGIGLLGAFAAWMGKRA